MILKLKRTPGLYLVGFMASGKSTVGPAVAEELGWSFSDIDNEIERHEGKTIAQIFSDYGEERFRHIESEELAKRVFSVQSGNPCVVATGGGAFAERRNWDIVENNGITVWLDCSLETVHRRLGGADATRPLSNDPDRMRTLYETRRPLYARADYHIDANCGNPEDVKSQILRLPIF